MRTTCCVLVLLSAGAACAEDLDLIKEEMAAIRKEVVAVRMELRRIEASKTAAVAEKIEAGEKMPTAAFLNVLQRDARRSALLAESDELTRRFRAAEGIATPDSINKIREEYKEKHAEVHKLLGAREEELLVNFVREEKLGGSAKIEAETAYHMALRKRLEDDLEVLREQLKKAGG